GKVIYVWFEAPIGYISATKEYFISINEPDKWKEYWMGENTKLIHFIGKDNIVFHSLIFPAALMAHGGYILPDNVPANEFLNISGSKLSKSKKNGILLKDIVEKFPPDVVRYTIASILPESKDSEFSWKDLQTKNNSELAGILGNFINRTVVFAKTKFDNKIPGRKNDDEILNLIKDQTQIISQNYDNFKLKDALTETMNIVRAANKYFNDTEPWKLVKDEKERCGEIINNCLQICYSVAILIYPFLPFTSEKILKILNSDKTNFKWDRIGGVNLDSGKELGENQILFPQIEDKQIEKEMESEIESD
ncbi:MAG: class I tRNA ligase family protein, partial [Ignavibacteria bacterium]